MVSRLVLGCGSVGTTIVDSISDSGEDLYVLDSDARRVETLRNDNVAASQRELTADAVTSLNRPADVVVVASDDAETNLTLARAARETYPDAVLVVYAGEEASPEVRSELESIADQFVDPGIELARNLLATVESDGGRRARALRRAVQDVDGKLGVFTHDNPDPDAIASAIALTRIADSVGVEAEACYFGEISHQENRALVNLLDLTLRNVEPGMDLSEFDGIALIDHAQPGVNDQLPSNTPIDIVVDHHPPKMPVDARFVDLREDVGATSTLMTEHLQYLDIEPESEIATGLLYGIRVDTDDFTRQVSSADFEAAALLIPSADTGVLERVESPSVSADTLSTIARAIRNRELEGSVLASCVGVISDRDALAQAADRLLTMEGVTTTLVYGYVDSTIYVSARSRGTNLDLGEVLRTAFGRIGSAGGHADMAGAQISLGLLGEVEEVGESAIVDIIKDIITERFFEVIQGYREAGIGRQSTNVDSFSELDDGNSPE